MILRNFEIEYKYFNKLGFQIYSKKSGDITLFSCPNCNEGTSYGKKHRFHWKYDEINKNFSYVNCFNCNYGKDFEFFIKDFGGEDEYKKLIKEYKSNGLTFETDFGANYFDEDLILSPQTKDFLDLKPLVKSKKASKYLDDRKLGEYKNLFLSDKWDNFIIPFYTKNKKLYGIQARIIDSKQFWFDIDNVNKKFRAWNFYNIDLSKPVYIFEGVEDALSSGLENIIAVLGKTIPDFILDKIDEPIICFDNDKDGILAMARYVSKNKKCKALVYPKDFRHKDMNELLQLGIEKQYIKKFILKNIWQGFKLSVLSSSLSK